MDFAAIVLQLFAIAAAGALAIYWRPSRPSFVWREISTSFATSDRHPANSLKCESIYAPTTFKHFLRDGHLVGEYAYFDIATNTDGLWLSYLGPAGKCAENLHIPWNYLVVSRFDDTSVEVTLLCSPPRVLRLSNKAGMLIAQSKPP